MNFPTDVTKAINCLLLHACAQQMRIPQPLGEAVGFPKGGRGISTGRTGGAMEFHLAEFRGPLSQICLESQWQLGEYPICVVSNSHRLDDLRIDRETTK